MVVCGIFLVFVVPVCGVCAVCGMFVAPVCGVCAVCGPFVVRLWCLWCLCILVGPLSFHLVRADDRGKRRNI